MTEPIKLDELPVDVAAFPHGGPDAAVSGIIYGPPRTRRGRLLNRIRRLFGLEERDEIYAYLEPAFFVPETDADVIRVRVGPDGILTFDDPDGEELEP